MKQKPLKLLLLLSLMILISASACQPDLVKNEPEPTEIESIETTFAPLESLSPNGSILLRDRHNTDGLAGDIKIEEGNRRGFGGIDVISTDNIFSSYCIVTSPFQAGTDWLSDRYFIYSFGKGDIMIYDLCEDKKTKISPKNFYSVYSIDPGRIVLEENSVDRELYTVEYSFDENGAIIINDENWNGVWTDTELIDIEDCVQSE